MVSALLVQTETEPFYKMTAKSRRRKFDKRRNTDERPHPRFDEEDARREACKLAHPAGKGLSEVQRVILESAGEEGQEVRVHSRVGRKGPFWQVELLDRGIGDHGTWTPEQQAEADEIRRRSEEAVRDEEASDTEALQESRGARPTQEHADEFQAWKESADRG